jgi:aryl-alcohol dehydrogenase-like predicted oxidoreductase
VVTAAGRGNGPRSSSQRNVAIQNMRFGLEYRPLGRTGLTVSQIAVGTVELGMRYGFRSSLHYEKPEEQEAIHVIHRALDLGINLIDTARSYGSSEELIGRALQETSERPVIATKVAILEKDLASGNSKKLRAAIQASIEASLKALKVEAVDLMQIHNTNAAILANEEVIRALEDSRQQGKARFLGASGSVCEDTSLAALEIGCFQTLQVPFNILDRKIVDHVLPRAAQQGVGILTRSAFLRGVLTDSVNVPEQLIDLRETALHVGSQFQEEVTGLSELALRFCLSFPGVSSVIVGVRSVSELESNVAASVRGRLSPDQLEMLCQISVKNSSLLDPQSWAGLI